MGSGWFKNAIFASGISLLTAWSVSADQGVGKIVSATGQVMARVEKKDLGRKGIPQVRALKSGDSVFREDVINTGSEGSVKILFSDQSIMDLGPSSLFKVDQFESGPDPKKRKVEMSLAYGRVRAAINQKVGSEGKFKIKTRAATMGVRGTEFYVMSDILSSVAGKESKGEVAASAPKTQVLVTEGKVEVTPSKAAGPKAPERTVAVLPGEKITVTAPEPSKSSVSSEAARMPASAPPLVERATPEEVKTVVSEVKLKDVTFAQAVKVDLTASPDRKPASSETPSVGVSLVGFTGTETLAVIKDTLLAKPELNTPALAAGSFVIPGAPGAAQGFNGNFKPGFNDERRLVHLRIHLKN